jgi:altronate hydrolase
VRRYNQIIGFATRDIAPGEHVHTHNLASASSRATTRSARACAHAYVAEPATFMGIVRADGRVATRNYIGVLTSVNCSATVARAIADHFRRDIRPQALARLPERRRRGRADARHRLRHGHATARSCRCCAARWAATRATQLRGGVLMVGLGCEANQIRACWRRRPAGSETCRPSTSRTPAAPRKTVARGIELVARCCRCANRVRARAGAGEPPHGGLQCGGSDGYSGITANPALGAAVDRLVRHGGTAILSETPEIYGAEHLLTRRAVSREVGEKLIARIRWWEDYTARNGGEMNNNPSPATRRAG